MDEFTRFPRTGNMDHEGDWYERGRKRLARCRLYGVIVTIYAAIMTVMAYVGFR